MARGRACRVAFWLGLAVMLRVEQARGAGRHVVALAPLDGTPKALHAPAFYRVRRGG